MCWFSCFIVVVFIVTVVFVVVYPRNLPLNSGQNWDDNSRYIVAVVIVMIIIAVVGVTFSKNAPL